MSIAETKRIYGKILLFGEYSIIKGGKALAIPFKRYSGFLGFPNVDDTENADFAENSNAILKDYYSFLLTVKELFEEPFLFDSALFQEDLQKGLFFNSTIPQGYGAGSSGALVAAVLQRYCRGFCKNVIEYPENHLFLLREIMARMETYFHGNSSGMDPLSSLIGKPVLIESEKRISFLNLDSFAFQKEYKIFLIDTQSTRNTKPLVEWFNKQTADGHFNFDLLNALNNQIIKAVLNNNSLFFDHFLSQISLFQLKNMQPMIPESLQPIWEAGLEDNKFVLKLCGSGGGGFVLGFTHDISYVKDILNTNGLSLIEVTV